jgi:3-oxoacyl-[acyl-carrier-protein] synthase III
MLTRPGWRAVLVTGADNFGVDPALGPDPAMRWHYARGGPTDRGSVLGDAATAAVLSNRSGFARVDSVATRSLSDLEALYRGGEPLFPPAVGRPFRLGERFAEVGREDPDGLRRALGRLRQARTDLARQVLAEAHVRPDQVTRVVHILTGTRGYLEHLLEPLGIDPDRGVLEFGRGVGHLGVNDPLAGLHHLVHSGQLRPGDRVLMMANGMGPTLGCAVLTMLDPPDPPDPAARR